MTMQWNPRTCQKDGVLYPEQLRDRSRDDGHSGCTVEGGRLTGVTANVKTTPLYWTHRLNIRSGYSIRYYPGQCRHSLSHGRRVPMNQHVTPCRKV